MSPRFVKAGVGALLVASGALMYAASWQRWAGACPWGDPAGAGCVSRQDHRYDVVVPTTPWEPIGHAAVLAGCSMLVLALVFVVLPWALTGRGPGRVSGAVLVLVVLAQAVVGATTLGSGLGGAALHPTGFAVALPLWLLAPPLLLVRFAVAARGWALAAVVALLLASPLVAAFSYAVGSYDARPWWEAVSGLLVAVAGACLLVAAALGRQPHPRRGPARSVRPLSDLEASTT